MIAELDLLGPINVGGTTLMNMEELAMKLQGIFGVQKPLRYSGESWPGDIARLVPDCGQLHSLGFKEAVSIDEGLDRFATWFRSRPERLAQS